MWNLWKKLIRSSYLLPWRLTRCIALSQNCWWRILVFFFLILPMSHRTFHTVRDDCTRNFFSLTSRNEKWDFFSWLRMINTGNSLKMDVWDEKIEKVSVYLLSWFPCFQGERNKNKFTEFKVMYTDLHSQSVHLICTRDASLFWLCRFFSKNVLFFNYI